MLVYIFMFEKINIIIFQHENHILYICAIEFSKINISVIYMKNKIILISIYSVIVDILETLLANFCTLQNFFEL